MTSVVTLPREVDRVFGRDALSLSFIFLPPVDVFVDAVDVGVVVVVAVAVVVAGGEKHHRYYYDPRRRGLTKLTTMNYD